MKQDPAIRAEAHGVLESLFRHIGDSRQAEQAPSQLGGLGVDLMEFVTMPPDLARIFSEMAFDLTEIVLNTLAEAGITLTKGLTPL